ncbi:MAG: hypothetical protein K2I71_02580, partial [Helicobacter sp.]|nr:hypothetical protein [Helicobacter sp.]
TDSNIQKNNQAIESKKSSPTHKQVLGYEVDKEGYFTQEFNKVAGIPEDYKIHSSTMQNLVKKETDDRKVFREYKSIDIAKTLGNAYKIVSQLLEKSPKLASKESFSKEDLTEYFPQNYKIDKQSGEVKQVYSYKEVKDILADGGFKGVSNSESIAPSFFTKDDSVIPKPFDANVFASGSFDVMIQKYTNKDGDITKGGLLVGFLSSNMHTGTTPTPLIAGEVTIWGKMQGLDPSISGSMVEDINKELDSLLDLDHFGEFLEAVNSTDIKEFKQKMSKIKVKPQEAGENSKSVFELMESIEENAKYLKYLLDTKNPKAKNLKSKNPEPKKSFNVEA